MRCMIVIALTASPIFSHLGYKSSVKGLGYSTTFFKCVRVFMCYKCPHYHCIFKSSRALRCPALKVCNCHSEWQSV